MSNFQNSAWETGWPRRGLLSSIGRVVREFIVGIRLVWLTAELVAVGLMVAVAVSFLSPSDSRDSDAVETSGGD